ncbi:MAG: methyltransferase [Betaproteobacteria bacterium]|nr:methyltransferase [Betaproteobacteria bacterium]
MPIISQRSRQDERVALYPPELLRHFDDSFIASFDLFEEYVARLTLSLFRSTGLAAACRNKATVSQAAARAGLVPGAALVPASWILTMLASRKWIDTTLGANGERLYRVEQALPALDPDEILEKQRAHDARCLPSYEIAALAAAHYPAVLRGQTSGEQALFGPAGIIPWVRYFSNDNPLYAISNTVGAIAAAQALPGGATAILEIGGGLGSGADTLLGELERSGHAAQLSSYHLTEISPLFLKRAQRYLAARHPLCRFVFSALDIDRAFSEAAIVPNTYSLVYGVNVLHVARDLAATLGELRNALSEGGMLVMAECIRPFLDTPLHLELVFNLLSSFRDAVLVPGWRPNGGFLTPEQWTAALEANGFEAVRIYPDIAAIRDAYPSFVVAAIVARRA